METSLNIDGTIATISDAIGTIIHQMDRLVTKLRENENILDGLDKCIGERDADLKKLETNNIQLEKELRRKTFALLIKNQSYEKLKKQLKDLKEKCQKDAEDGIPPRKKTKKEEEHEEILELCESVWQHAILYKIVKFEEKVVTLDDDSIAEGVLSHMEADKENFVACQLAAVNRATAMAAEQANHTAESAVEKEKEDKSMKE